MGIFVVTDGSEVQTFDPVYFSLPFIFQRRSLFCLMGCKANGGVLRHTHTHIICFHFCTKTQLICWALTHFNRTVSIR